MAAFLLPQYPQAEKVSEQKMRIEGMRFILAVYKTNDSPERVIDFYKKALAEDFEFSGNSNSALFTNKEGLSVNLSCAANPFDKTTMIQAYYNLDSLDSLENTGLPAQDVMAKELYGVRPYPNSTQVSSFETDIGFRVVYQSKTDCQDCLIDYYRKEFSTWGWDLVKDGKQGLSMPQELSADIPQASRQILQKYIDAVPREQRKINYYLMMFEKGDERCTVTVNSSAGGKAQAMIDYRR